MALVEMELDVLMINVVQLGDGVDVVMCFVIGKQLT